MMELIVDPAVLDHQLLVSFIIMSRSSNDNIKARGLEGTLAIDASLLINWRMWLY